MLVRWGTAAILAGDIASTFGSASLPSMRSVVFSSSPSLTAPTLRSPGMASTISLRMRDLARGFAFALSVFAIVHLHHFVFRDQRSYLLRGQFEEPPRKTPEFAQLLSADVASLILGEAVQKHRPIAAPESDHCPVAAALSLADARQALLDQTAPEVGVYKPCL